MARHIDNDADFLQITAAPNTPTTGSLVFWAYPTWAQTDSVDHILF